MMRYFFCLICIFQLMTPAWADEKQNTPPVEISQEDLKVIHMMETLELMEVVDRIDLLEDMEILIEEEGKENDEN